MSKPSSVKKSVSFRQDVFETAEEMADKYFGGNFSAYITYLICADKHGLSRAKESVEDTLVKEEMKETYTKSRVNEDYIDQFLNI